MFSSKSDKARFSKMVVNRAGEVLVNDPNNEEALEILDYWRAIHAEMLGNEHEYADNFSYGNVFVKGSARIKRTISILEKLKRYPAMKLSRMQDIAGIRFVVDISTASFAPAEIFQNFVSSFQENLSRYYVKKNINNYLSVPKISGYRAVHLVCEHQNDIQTDFNGLLLEIQFRTRLQHLWAMAVETVGMFYGQALKSSRGDQGWLDFFRLASAAFSHVEQAPVVAIHAGKTSEQIRQELQQEGSENSYFTKLSAIKEVAEEYPEKEYEYWLLELNIKQEKNRVFGFKTDQLEAAQELYAFKEKTPACRNGDVQVVLVSTQSFKDLREAYPSYFLDVAEFTKTIKNICDEGII